MATEVPANCVYLWYAICRTLVIIPLQVSCMGCVYIGVAFLEFTISDGTPSIESFNCSKNGLASAAVAKHMEPSYQSERLPISPWHLYASLACLSPPCARITAETIEQWPWGGGPCSWNHGF